MFWGWSRDCAVGGHHTDTLLDGTISRGSGHSLTNSSDYNRVKVVIFGILNVLEELYHHQLQVPEGLKNPIIGKQDLHQKYQWLKPAVRSSEVTMIEQFLWMLLYYWEIFRRFPADNQRAYK